MLLPSCSLRLGSTTQNGGGGKKVIVSRVTRLLTRCIRRYCNDDSVSVCSYYDSTFGSIDDSQALVGGTSYNADSRPSNSRFQEGATSHDRLPSSRSPRVHAEGPWVKNGPRLDRDESRTRPVPDNSTAPANGPCTMLIENLCRDLVTQKALDEKLYDVIGKLPYRQVLAITPASSIVIPSHTQSSSSSSFPGSNCAERG